MTTKKETLPIILQFGKLMNYEDWRLDQIDRSGIVFGKQVNVLKNYIKHVPRLINESDWRPIDQEVEEGEEQPPAYTAGALMEFRKEAEKRRMKIVSNLEENESKFYATLWQSMSLESKEQIKQHVNFVQADLDQDPNVLVLMARDTHLTDIHGAGEALKQMQKETTKCEYNAFTQKPNVSITEFKKEFDGKLLILEGMGVAKPEEPELAMTFLMRLDPLRYAEMITSLSNMAVQGIAFPQTLQSAYNAASSWKTINRKMGNSEAMHSVFAYTDEVVAHNGGRGGRDGRGGRGRDGRGRDGRGRDGDGGGRGRGGRDGEGGRGRGGRGGEQQAPITLNSTKTCRHCLKKGHIAVNCPDNPDGVPVENRMVLYNTEAIGENDDNDVEELYTTFMITSESSSASVMFTSTEVLLDNQAGRSIFKNKSFLDDIKDQHPYSLGGVDGSAEGFKVSQGGSFRDLGRVGYSPRAAANILSQPQLLNQGYKIVYDDLKDRYHLAGLSSDYYFERKYLSNGDKSSHYTCELANVLVNTVEDNMRRYTKREVLEAKAARETFTNRLAYMTSSTAIAMIKIRES